MKNSCDRALHRVRDQRRAARMRCEKLETTAQPASRHAHPLREAEQTAHPNDGRRTPHWVLDATPPLDGLTGSLFLLLESLDKRSSTFYIRGLRED
eukprot:scaffold90634_cov33-Tisochrysis_lutea.AAC.1